MTATEFLNHPVHQKTEQLISRLQEREVADKLEIEKQDYFKTAVNFAIERLKISFPSLIAVAELNAVSTEFENALGQINAFVGDDNVGHLNNAVNNITSAMTYIRNLPIHINKTDLDFSKNIASFQETIQNKYKQTEKSQNELEERFRLTNEKLIEKDNEIKWLNDSIVAKQTEIQNLITTLQTQVDTSITTYTKQVADDRNIFRDEITADRETIKLDTAEIIKDLERKLSDASKLVNVIGNVGVTGNYQNIANHHKDTANTWRTIAIGFMCLLSSLLIYSIWKISDPAYDWHKAIIRIVSAAILIYPATYAARESSKHRRLENYNRKAELELAAINPFIEILDETKKQAIKEKLVDKYFGNTVNFDKEIDKEKDVSIDLLEKVVTIITRVTQK
jgi:hypothetical protein